MTKNFVPLYKTVDEVMQGAVKSTLLEDVRKQITEEGSLELSGSSASDELAAWSLIANKIVGHEDDPTF